MPFDEQVYQQVARRLTRRACVVAASGLCAAVGLAAGLVAAAYFSVGPWGLLAVAAASELLFFGWFCLRTYELNSQPALHEPPGDVAEHGLEVSYS